MEDMKGGIYGSHLPAMQAVMQRLLEQIGELRRQIAQGTGFDPVEHCLSRIKSEDSMREKCRRKGLPETTDSALRHIHDAIGIRIVCAFVDDVRVVRDHLASLDGVEVIEEKDYIRHAKPNGYRSYHVILRVDGQYYVEVQIRTIAMDTWAALEHHLKYKKNGGSRTDLLIRELKRCSDELASTDMTLQTIRDMILEDWEDSE